MQAKFNQLRSYPHNVACCCFYSSEEQEQSQGKGNAQVEVDKVVELLNQLFPVKGKEREAI